jgi:multidrug efflux pump subunit AcrB
MLAISIPLISWLLTIILYITAKKSTSGYRQMSDTRTTFLVVFVAFAFVGFPIGTILDESLIQPLWLLIAVPSLAILARLAITVVKTTEEKMNTRQTVSNCLYGWLVLSGSPQ